MSWSLSLVSGLAGSLWSGFLAPGSGAVGGAAGAAGAAGVAVSSGVPVSEIREI